MKNHLHKMLCYTIYLLINKLFIAHINFVMLIFCIYIAVNLLLQLSTYFFILN